MQIRKKGWGLQISFNGTTSNGNLRNQMRVPDPARMKHKSTDSRIQETITDPRLWESHQHARDRQIDMKGVSWHSCPLGCGRQLSRLNRASSVPRKVSISRARPCVLVWASLCGWNKFSVWMICVVIGRDRLHNGELLNLSTGSQYKEQPFSTRW